MRAQVKIYIISFALLQPNFASGEERDFVHKLLKESIECPVPISKTVDGQSSYLFNIKHTYRGDFSNFRLRSEWKDAEMSIEGESYTGNGVTTISTSFSAVGPITISGAEVTISCRGRKKCIRAEYVANPGHDPEWEDYVAKISSYTIKSCSKDSANDIADAMRYLSK